MVPRAVAVAGRVLFAGRAVEHGGAGPVRSRPAAHGPGPSACVRPSCVWTTGAPGWRRGRGRRSRSGRRRRARCRCRPCGRWCRREPQGGRRTWPRSWWSSGSVARRRHMSKHDYLLSNASPTTPLAEYARVFKAEHRIEECLAAGQRGSGSGGLRRLAPGVAITTRPWAAAAAAVPDDGNTLAGKNGRAALTATSRYRR